MTKIYTIFLFLVIMTACNKDDDVGSSTYPKLNGTYEYSRYRAWNHGLYETSDYLSWQFNSTNQAWKYTCSWSYTTEGWYNASKEGSGDFMEWKIENGMLYSRLWKNNYDSWDVQTFQYLNSDTILIDGNIYSLK